MCLLAPALAEPPVGKAPGDTEIQALGTVNGQALACRYFGASKTAKALMTRFALKTRRYGALFESSTNAAFAAQVVDAGSCPGEVAIGLRLSELAAALEQVFWVPAKPATTRPEPGS
ncbi:MAG: hypothetical protein WBM40_24140 [Thiohalocapsa sp.]